MNIIDLFILLTLLILIILFRKAIRHIQQKKQDRLNERKLLKLLNVTSIIELYENKHVNEHPEHQLMPWQDVIKCPIVRFNESVIIVAFRSPPDTWKELAGIAGELTICRKTKQQINFRITCMN